MLSGRYAEEREKLCSIHFAWKPCRMKLWKFEIFVYREMNNNVYYELKIDLILNFAISSLIHISDWSRISVLFTYLDFIISHSKVIDRFIFLLFR